MNIWTAIIVVAIVIETIAELCKQWFPVLSQQEWAIRLTTILLGVLVAFTYSADLFAALGMTASIPHVGIILTGVLTAGGSNIVFDIINRIRGKSDELAASLRLTGDTAEVVHDSEDSGYVG